MTAETDAPRPAVSARHRDPHRIAFDLIFVVFLVTIVIRSIDLRPDARLVPLIVAVPSCAAMVARTLFDVRGAAVSDKDETKPSSVEQRRQRIFVSWALGLVAAPVLATEFLDPVLGLRTYFIPAAAVGMLFILRWIGLTWIKTVAYTAGIVAFVYVILGVLLNVRL